MSLSSFSLSKSWESATAFPTYEEDEAQVRADMQCLFDELADGLNVLINALNRKTSGSGASQIGVEPIANMDGVTDVQSALALLRSLIVDISSGAVDDGAISATKLADEAVTTPKIAGSAVTTAKLADGAVNNDKCDFSEGLDVDGALAVNDTLDVNGEILLSSDCYGDALPETATAGRLFFLRVQ